MSAAENKAATEAAYQAFAAGDLEGAMKNLADDVEWIVPGNSTVSGTYRGKAEVAGFFATLAGKSFRTEPQHFVAEGDHVVVLTHTTSEGDVSADQADVLTFRDGKVVKFQSATDTALLEAVWGKKE
jgi:ketosteroid isomerase-like protein